MDPLWDGPLGGEMVEQEAAAFLDRFTAMGRIAEAVVGPRDDVQGSRVARRARRAGGRGRAAPPRRGRPGSRARARRPWARRPGRRAAPPRRGRGRPGPGSAPASSRSDAGAFQVTTGSGARRRRAAAATRARRSRRGSSRAARSGRPAPAAWPGGPGPRPGRRSGSRWSPPAAARRTRRCRGSRSARGRGRPRAARAELQVLVAVLGGAHAVTGDHAGAGETSSGRCRTPATSSAPTGTREAVLAHAQTRSKRRQVLTESWYIASSTGQPLDLGHLFRDPRDEPRARGARSRTRPGTARARRSPPAATRSAPTRPSRGPGRGRPAPGVTETSSPPRRSRG